MKTGVANSARKAPQQNFARGLLEVNLPELGTPSRGKVRDSWVVSVGGTQYRVLVTTDRLSAFDSIICTVPGKGQVLNLLAAYWFDQTQDIIPNHLMSVPHPNVLFAKQAQATLPVEMVVRRYMAQSSTTTSIYHNYAVVGRRQIYGVDFPDGLQPNQELPMGTIITPTTKSETGHDEELTDDEARTIVDSTLGVGMWDSAKTAAYQLFERGRAHCLKCGLILADTKYEFGIDSEGKLMLIDEIHTPDSSRYWFTATYQDRLRAGEPPDSFDKEILRRWLALHGFTGDGPIPVVDPTIIDAVAQAYTVPYTMITGLDLPLSPVDDIQSVVSRFITEYREKV